MDETKNEQGRELERKIKRLGALASGNISYGLQTQTEVADQIVKDVCDYVTAIESENQRLAAIVDVMTVVEVECCGWTKCPASTKDGSCTLGHLSFHNIKEGERPYWCDLSKGPVMLKLKGKDNGIG